ncbi:hypothetical protein LO772_04305 [Yinghuangia sp. ASG 101]|uniref:hypothetical protein n=1 Tax=Yinghuangia sp. ASG 101 TaxID=2896848 RepID=UPI001E5C8D1E|nr:hypothetical protein [Yinghuangia sp. ASG 101]UGQ12851.1 hypothetical protein LO772_04305 [Yinghuangia sp. ASG 101]
MEWDRVADELYALPPGEFTAAREEFASAAVKAGDKALARRIRALRKPPLAAWASNLLVRARPDEARALLELGGALRQAHHDVDPDLLRTLSAQQRQLTAALARQARILADESGHPIGDQVVHEIQGILHAALADPDAADAWASGRLARTLSAAGFPTGTAAPREEPPDTPTARKPRTAATGEAARRTRDQAAREEHTRLHDELRRARHEAGEAAQAARDADKERAAGERALAHALEQRDRAERRVADLTARLEAAERARADADADATRARDRLKFAERAAHEAHTTADTAATRVDHLTHRLRP